MIWKLLKYIVEILRWMVSLIFPVGVSALYTNYLGEISGLQYGCNQMRTNLKSYSLGFLIGSPRIPALTLGPSICF